MEHYAIKMAEWLQKRVEAAEQNDPDLAVLKQKVRETTEVVRAAKGDDLAIAIRAQDAAIWALINHKAVRPV